MRVEYLRLPKRSDADPNIATNTELGGKAVTEILLSDLDEISQHCRQRLGVPAILTRIQTGEGDILQITLAGCN